MFKFPMAVLRELSCDVPLLGAEGISELGWDRASAIAEVALDDT
jgi:hypothetical protein